MPCIGTVDIAHLRSPNRTYWPAIVAFAIRARTIPPALQNPGDHRNAALARSCRPVTDQPGAIPQTLMQRERRSSRSKLLRPGSDQSVTCLDDSHIALAKQ